MKRMFISLGIISLLAMGIVTTKLAIAQSSPPPLPACDTASTDFDGDGVLNDVDADRTDSCLCISPNCAEGQTCVDDPSTTDEDEAGSGDGNPECDDTGIPYPDEV